MKKYEKYKIIGINFDKTVRNYEKVHIFQFQKHFEFEISSMKVFFILSYRELTLKPDITFYSSIYSKHFALLQVFQFSESISWIVLTPK